MNKLREWVNILFGDDDTPPDPLLLFLFPLLAMLGLLGFILLFPSLINK